MDLSVLSMDLNADILLMEQLRKFISHMEKVFFLSGGRHLVNVKKTKRFWLLVVEKKLTTCSSVYHQRAR